MGKVWENIAWFERKSSRIIISVLVSLPQAAGVHGYAARDAGGAAATAECAGAAGMGSGGGCVRGSTAVDFSLWGGDYDGESLVEFLRWHTYETGQLLHKYIEIEEDLYINNGSGSPKIYFDIDSVRPTHIEGYQGGSLKVLEMTVGGSLMMRLNNYEGTTPDFIGCYENTLMNKDLTMVGAIKGDGNSDLEFKVSGAGKIKFTKV